MQCANRVILIALSCHADVAIFHLRDSLGGLLVIADENLAESLLHGIFNSLIKFDEIDGKACPSTGQLLDMLEALTGHFSERDLFQRHESDAMGKHPPFDQVFGNALLGNDNVLKLTPCRLLQSEAVLVRLAHREQSAEFAKNLITIEVRVGTLVLEAHQVLNVLELVSAEHSLHLLLLLLYELLVLCEALCEIA